MKIILLFKQISKEAINEEFRLKRHYDAIDNRLKDSYVLETSVKKECIGVFSDALMIVEAKKAVWQDILHSHLVNEEIKKKWLKFSNDFEKNIMHYIYNKAAIRYEIVEKEITKTT